MTATTMTAPTTPRSQYIALLEREVAVDLLRAKAERLKEEHELAMRSFRTKPNNVSLLVTLDPWIDAMNAYHSAAFTLRNDRNAYVLALVSENERLRGMVR